VKELIAHPAGESEKGALVLVRGPVPVDTFAGRVHVEWDPQAAVTPLGQLAFFAQYLKVSGLFDPWAEECPLQLSSPNAPPKRDVLGTAVLSILSGHQRYAHINGLRGDGIDPELLGMSQVDSEGCVRRNIGKLDETKGNAWLQRHLHLIYAPLLSEPWILDADVTVKVLFGHQEGAVLGYNPHKPGHPSHTYHTYMIANLRLILDVEVQAGNQHASKHAVPVTSLDESLGLGWIHDPRSQALPIHGAHDRPGLRPVKPVRASCRAAQAHRIDHQPAIIFACTGQTDPPWQAHGSRSATLMPTLRGSRMPAAPSRRFSAP